MKSCPRCHANMLQEPFTDPQGRGQRWTCIACGEFIEEVEPNAVGMTLEQHNDLSRPRRGRPRKVR